MPKPAPLASNLAAAAVTTGGGAEGVAPWALAEDTALDAGVCVMIVGGWL